MRKLKNPMHIAERLGIPATLALLLISTACNAQNVDETITGQTLPTLAENGLVYSLIPAAEGTAELRQAALALQYTAGDDINLGGLDLVMVRYELPDNVTGAEAIASLESAVPTSTVGVNHAYRLQASDENSDKRNFATTMLNWPVGGCTANVPVGIVDGGVNSNAPALSQTKVVNRDFGTGSKESLQHGTEVASVLANPSRIQGLSLYSANVISPDPSGQDAAGAASIVQALDWMASQRVKLVNISLAGPKNKLLKLAIDKSSDLGITLVAAAGNQGRAAPPQFPAAFPSVVAVTAVDVNKRAFKDAVRGQYIDIAAPGVDVYVTSTSGGRYVSGTSIAVPFVTARLATQTNSNRNELFTDALDLGATGKDEVFGHGLLQAKNSCQPDASSK